MRRAPAGILALMALTAFAACGLEDPIYTGLFRDEHLRVPDPAPVLVLGAAPGLGGGKVVPWTGDGLALEDRAATIASGGGFTLELSGVQRRVGLVLEARRRGEQRLAVLPEQPGQEKVTDPEIRLELGKVHASLDPISGRSTTITLVLLARVRLDGGGLNGLDPGAIIGALDALSSDLDPPSGPVAALDRLVSRVLAAAATSPAGTPPPFDPGASSVPALVRERFWRSVSLDLDEDGEADGTPGVLIDALLAAAQGFQFQTCFPTDRVRVVLQVQLQRGQLDGNCAEIDPFKWARDEDGRTAFLTGGVHEDTPRCEDDRPAKGCLVQAQVDEINAAMGNWVPNKVRMWDDGLHGDLQAGDGIWGLVLDLPFIPIDPTDPEGRGLRLGYKYTYAFGGEGWTSTEEWPGNSRILEVVDLSGDRMVVRRDAFGDETRNKNKANLRTPANGGCGFVTWEADKIDGCFNDSRENRIDADGDCVDESWPAPGGLGPLTVPCPETP